MLNICRVEAMNSIMVSRAKYLPGQMLQIRKTSTRLHERYFIKVVSPSSKAECDVRRIWYVWIVFTVTEETVGIEGFRIRKVDGIV